MAERELAKQSKSSKSKQYTQKEFDELTKLMPDPATQQDSLLADGTLYGCVCVCLCVFESLGSSTSQS